MAYRIFCERMLRCEPITVYGDGKQSRSNTYIEDCVSATLAALNRPADGATFNIGGGKEIELLAAIEILAEYLGVRPILLFEPARHGDQRRTVADIALAKDLLGWVPNSEPETGLFAEMEWVRLRASSGKR